MRSCNLQSCLRRGRIRILAIIGHYRRERSLRMLLLSARSIQAMDFVNVLYQSTRPNRLMHGSSHSHKTGKSCNYALVTHCNGIAFTKIKFERCLRTHSLLFVVSIHTLQWTDNEGVQSHLMTRQCLGLLIEKGLGNLRKKARAKFDREIL